jgi:hypothetical protein
MRLLFHPQHVYMNNAVRQGTKAASIKENEQLFHRASLGKGKSKHNRLSAMLIYFVNGIPAPLGLKGIWTIMKLS